MSHWTEEVAALIKGGFATTNEAGKKLRKEIVESGSTVGDWLKAKTVPAEVPFMDPGDPITEMADISAIMQTLKTGFVDAKLLRSEILKSSSSVKEYLAASAQHVQFGGPPQMALMKAAGELITLAGDKDKAIRALEAFEALG